MPKSSDLTGPLPRALALWLTTGSRPERKIETAIYDAFREAILSGELPPDTRLMAHRKMAATLGVARSTVQLAFERLASDGYIDAASGRGTFVSNLGSDARDKRVRVHKPSTKDAQRPDETLRLGAFRAGIPALDCFPRDRWMHAMRRVVAEMPTQMLDKREPHGYGPLREAILTHVARTRGIRGAPNNVLIVAGAQAAFTLIARTLVRPGEAVCVEDPGYISLREALEAAHAKLVPCAVDRDGLDVDEARKLCLNPRAVAVTASHHIPLGVQMSITRRVALLAWARSTGGYVIEDDYDSEFRFGGSPLPALQSIDTAQRVIYVGTFSKTMFPSLRLAYIIAPDHLIDDLRRVQRQTGSVAPAFDQAALDEFIREGDFARHLRRMTRVYGRRRKLILAALERAFDDGELRILNDTMVGLHIGASIPNSARIRDIELVAAMRDEGVMLSAFSSYAVRARVNGLVFGLGGASEDAIDPSIAKLRAVWDRLRPERPSMRNSIAS